MHRLARTGVLAAALLLAVTACSSSDAVGSAVESAAVDQVDKVVDEKYEVTYEVTGAGAASISFAAGAGTATQPQHETVDAPSLPWTKTVTLRGIMPPTVLPVAAAGSEGGITCKITYKGKVIAEQSGEALTAAGGCVAVSPAAG
ncbi:MmpS family transport accessory protein [Streptomyces sp. NPDC090077]|uniref:MmpS family transport accessory protein n=1 Tax=Streptomyces sp. NPDC090077 TaxID=3365938 RepID=UPI0037FCC396